MKISITGKHIEVGESLHAHFEKTIRHLVEKQLGDVLEAHVAVSKETFEFAVEISIHVSRHFIVRTHASDVDPYRAGDLALEKMGNRIHRYKERLRDRHRKEEDAYSVPHYVIPTEKPDLGEETPLIIAEMTHDIPTVSVGEAVMRMDLSDTPVMMFKNAKTGSVNVVYRRPDGNVGWIDPSITLPKD